MRHYRVTLADALEAHEDSLEIGGGRHGLSSLSSLEGALGRPYHGYHRRIWDKAAALLHGVATSHGFTDGNKRTAFLLTCTMLDRSGYTLVPEPGDNIPDLMVDVVNGDVTQDQLVQWLRDRIQPF
ncbi:type II toxin-antitoxin system death-on-curing family toxin [Ruegeria arenilitoris]|uniref:type II toxin-antitoxin system death-on-curing family toxin n=1 Tax=Ruegeria arenilitoris TaxID=1173585 RepID=UPI00147C4400|nr:type II toxin-antitoxin system death-on-curing family toxin [Ruegeria arenilitoris]